VQQTNIELTPKCADANEFCNENEAPLRYFNNEMNVVRRPQVRSVYNNTDAGVNLTNVRRNAEDVGSWYDIDKMKAERAGLLDMTVEKNSNRSLRDDYAGIEGGLANTNFV
jgi:hypothetical protein